MTNQRKEPTLSSQADAIDMVIRAGVMNHLRKAGLRESEVDLVIERLQGARSTLRFLAPMQKELKSWIEVRGRG